MAGRSIMTHQLILGKGSFAINNKNINDLVKLIKPTVHESVFVQPVVSSFSVFVKDDYGFSITPIKLEIKIYAKL